MSFLWATSSVAWLMSIILVVTIISASLCLCGMSFEQVWFLLVSQCAFLFSLHKLLNSDCVQHA